MPHQTLTSTAPAGPDTPLLTALRQALQSQPDVRLAILYGSQAVGRSRPDSDVDLAVYCQRPLDATRKMQLAAGLENCLHREIDLVDLHHATGALLKQILQHGRVLIKESAADMENLTKRMVYDQEDLMPYVRRTLLERQRRFLDG